VSFVIYIKTINQIKESSERLERKTNERKISLKDGRINLIILHEEKMMMKI
jgi:hypothetical protein